VFFIPTVLSPWDCDCHIAAWLDRIVDMSKHESIMDQKVHITRAEGVCGGKPCVTSSRIRVQDIYVWHELQGRSPDEIVSDFPSLTLADVYAALAYFWDHRDTILEDMARDDAVVKQAKAEHPTRLRARSQGEDAVSS
jgi:uncharacterized protein (DUF433 family)